MCRSVSPENNFKLEFLGSRIWSSRITPCRNTHYRHLGRRLLLLHQGLALPQHKRWGHVGSVYYHSKWPELSTGRNPGRLFTSDKAPGNRNQARGCCVLSFRYLCSGKRSVLYEVELKHHLHGEGSTAVRPLTRDVWFGPTLPSSPGQRSQPLSRATHLTPHTDSPTCAQLS